MKLTKKQSPISLSFIIMLTLFILLKVLEIKTDIQLIELGIL